MPLPLPRKREKQQDFIGRCMGHKEAKKFEDNKQRFAVCMSQYRKGKKQNMQLNSYKHLMSALIRKEMFEGRPHWVVPTVLMVEGVHNGSGGPILWSAEELAKFPQAWNGEPLPVFHPNKNGEPISANDPDIVEKQSVGRVWNCKFEDGKLKGEAWIDIQKAADVEGGKEVMAMLQENKPVEVSTGMFSEEEFKEGEWNGESFVAIAKNIRPDHLALLPGGKGACSWEDGAGMPRLNQDPTRTPEPGEENKESIKEAIKDLMEAAGIDINELSHEDIHMGLWNALRASFEKKKNDHVHIVDVFNKVVVFEMSNFDDMPSEGKLMKVGFSIDKNNTISLQGDAMEVRREVKFVPVANEEESKTESRVQANKEGETKMERTEQIEALIAGGSWSENDREFLTNMDETQFEKVNTLTLNASADEGEEEEEGKDGDKIKGQAKHTGAVAKRAAKKATDQGDSAAAAKKMKTQEEQQEDKPATVDEYIANAPEEMQEVLASGLKMHRDKKDTLIKQLEENKRNQFEKEELENKSVAELVKLANLAQIEVDYTGRAGGPQVNESEVPEMPRMQWNKENK